MSSLLIDPYKVTDFSRPEAELQAFFLFCTAVAGKKATVIASKLAALLDGCGESRTPLSRVRELLSAGLLEEEMRRVSLGKYGLLGRCWREWASRPDDFLRTASVPELEGLPGVGPKTARFFVVHSRPGAEHAVVDTHMLKFLRDAGHADIPAGNAAPASRYAALEEKVLRHARMSGMPPHQFDLAVWTWYSQGGRGLPAFAAAGA